MWSEAERTAENGAFRFAARTLQITDTLSFWRNTSGVFANRDAQVSFVTGERIRPVVDSQIKRAGLRCGENCRVAERNRPQHGLRFVFNVDGSQKPAERLAFVVANADAVRLADPAGR